MHWIEKMIGIFFNGLNVLYYRAKFGEIELRAPAVNVKMWCLYVFLSVTLRSRHTVSANEHCVAVYASILCHFSVLFGSDLSFRRTRQF